MTIVLSIAMFLVAALGTGYAWYRTQDWELTLMIAACAVVVAGSVIALVCRKKKKPTNKFASINFDALSGHDFENFCAELLRKNGFEKVEVTRASGDHGVDIMAHREGIVYAIQCKRYESNVGNAAIQQIYAGKAIYDADIAVVLTNRYFTKQAEMEAECLHVKLWDRDRLRKFIASVGAR